MSYEVVLTSVLMKEAWQVSMSDSSSGWCGEVLSPGIVATLMGTRRRTKAAHKEGQSQEEPREMELDPDDILPWDYTIPEVRPTLGSTVMGQISTLWALIQFWLGFLLLETKSFLSDTHVFQENPRK